MSEPMSEQELAEIRARWDKATPGPWSTQYGVRTSRVVAKTPKGFGTIVVCQDWEPRSDFVGTFQGDAEAIAAAPTDIAALLAEVERLRADVGQAHELLRGIREYLWSHGPISIDDDRLTALFEKVLPEG